MSALVEAPSRVEAELLTPDEALAHDQPWDALAGRAIEPNVFLSRWMAGARLRHLPDRSGARILAAWRHAGRERRLVGLHLLVRSRGRHLNPLPVMRAAELYAPLSTPLLDAERPAEVWSAMLDASARAGIAALALPFLGADGPVAAALRKAAGSRPIVVTGRHQRAFLQGGADDVRSALQPRRRKEADRQRRRLAEKGALDVVVARSSVEAVAALEEFLRLESSGWKGREGTDLAAVPGAAAYFREAARTGAQESAFRVVTMTLDRRPIAAGLLAIAGRRAFYVKTAYDEAFARYSPGVLLTLALTERIGDDPSIDDADSVADADHPMIDRIWTGRQPIEAVLVATRPGGGAAFRLALAIERARMRSWDAAKRAAATLRRRLP